MKQEESKLYIFVAAALITALLFFVAVGYSSWPGCILGGGCTHESRGKTTGALLITAGLLTVLCAIFLIVLVTVGEGWSHIAAAVVAVIASILAMAGVFYFLDKSDTWSPFIATVAMSLTITLVAIIIEDIILGEDN